MKEANKRALVAIGAGLVVAYLIPVEGLSTWARFGVGLSSAACGAIALFWAVKGWQISD
jgi:hypothetical protein